MKCDVKKCKAECCGIVPFEKKWFDKSKLVRKVEIHEFEGLISAFDKDNYCGFLGYDFKCSIYNDRPEICKKFGDESDPFLVCPWENKDGETRCRGERRRLKRKIDKVTEKFYKQKTINKL